MASVTQAPPLMTLPPLDLTQLSDMQAHRLMNMLRKTADDLAAAMQDLPFADPLLTKLQQLFIDTEALVSDVIHDLLDRYQADSQPPF